MNRIRVIVGGRTLADTTRAVRVLETAGAPVYYVPAADVRLDLLRPNDRTTTCEWKGRAAYLDYDDGSRTIASVGWSYPAPSAAFEALRHAVAFYAGRVDEAWVGEERARPQPGAFYGGWVTDAIVGPIKGEPGSEWW